MKRRAKKKDKPAASNSRPSSSCVIDDDAGGPPVIDDDAGGPPVIVVLHYLFGTKMCILQLKPPGNNLVHDAPQLTPLEQQIEKRQLNENDFVEHIDFIDREPEAEKIPWLFAPPSSPNSYMYIVANHVSARDDRFPGYIYDINTKEKQDIKSFSDFKCHGSVVSCRGQVYFLAHLDTFYPRSHHSFEYYDLDQGNWVPLQHYPFHLGRSNGNIQATAVWKGTLLFNLDKSSEFWAFDVAKNKWYLVEVIDEGARTRNSYDNRCYTIYGRAVVLGNTIYALTYLDANAVLELSITKRYCDGDFAFKLSLVSMILVPGLKPIGFDNVLSVMWSGHLVHMGEDKFCVVQSCFFYMLSNYQPLQLTSIKLEEKNGVKSMTVTGSCLYEVDKGKDEMDNTFKVVLCFSLPEAEGPGHYIYVSNLPAEATEEELEMKLKKFGPIKRDGIRFNRNETGNYSACVEFESQTSKQRAIEASTIRIGGCRAEIEEKTIVAPSLN